MKEVDKKPFDIATVVRRIRKEVTKYKDAAMFDLRSHGYNTIFQQLVACIISIRTYDEVSLPVSIALLERAPTPEKMAKLSEREIDKLISKATFHESKARDIRATDLVRVQLESKLPKRYWIEINRLLVPFGKHVCTGRLPKCSVCPVLEYCRQVGVAAHR